LLGPSCANHHGKVELRLKPEEKPWSEDSKDFPKDKDITQYILPLIDSYAGPVRAKNMDNPRLSPILCPIETLPKDILLCIAGIDILVDEQRRFVSRLKEEIARDPKYSDRQVESVYFAKGFHGYLSCKWHSSLSEFQYFQESERLNHRDEN
jgi:acetyl esterase/lipase